MVTTTYKSGGILAFYKGFWLSNLNVLLFTGIDLMTYETTKLWLTQRSDQGEHHTPDNDWSVNWMSATCSTILGVSICYPISTLITRVQVNDGQYNSVTTIIIILVTIVMTDERYTSNYNNIGWYNNNDRGSTNNTIQL